MYTQTMIAPVLKDEEIIAENILKRAEIARITRQLKTRLAKAGLKAKIDSQHDTREYKSESAINPKMYSADPNLMNLHELKAIPPSIVTKRPSSILENNDSESDFEVSPAKKTKQIDLPSSPFQAPSTPPLPQHVAFDKLPQVNEQKPNKSKDNEKDVKETDKHLLRTPRSSHKRMNSSSMKTPTGKYYNDDEGADLLMFLATSPSPAAYKTTIHNFTPKSSGITLPNFSLISSPAVAYMPAGTNLTTHLSSSKPALTEKLDFVTPATPKRLNLPLPSKTPNHHTRQNSNSLINTPSGFNVNDYLNFFTPSPKRAGINNTASANYSKTPDLFNKNNNITSNPIGLSGKMINFDKVSNFGITTNSNGVARFSGSPLRK